MNNLLRCVISVALLSGCSVLSGISPEYPQDWPPVSSAAGDACPELTGRYENIGAYSFLASGGANSLAYRLGGVATDADAVALAHSSTMLRVEVFNNGALVAEKLLSQEEGDFSCSEGAIVLPVTVQKSADGTGGSRSESRLYLRRAEDGALIGEERSWGIGAIFWLVPVGGWQTFWFQWSRQ